MSSTTKAEHVLTEQARLQLPHVYSPAYWRWFRRELIDSLHDCTPHQEAFLLQMIRIASSLERLYSEQINP